MIWIIIGVVLGILASGLPALWFLVSHLRHGDEFERRMAREYERERRMLDRIMPPL